MFRSAQNTLPNIFFVQTHTQDGFFDVIVRQGNNQEEELQMRNTIKSNEAQAAGQEEEEEDEDQNKNHFDVQTLLKNIECVSDEKVKHLKSQLLHMTKKLTDEIEHRNREAASFSKFRETSANSEKSYDMYKTENNKRIEAG